MVVKFQIRAPLAFASGAPCGLLKVNIEFGVIKHGVAEKISRGNIQNAQQNQQCPQIDILIFIAPNASVRFVGHRRAVTKSIYSKMALFP